MAFIEKDFRVKNGIIVDSGSVLLNGTGQIQGIDVVTNPTDAASKEYVDTAVANAGGGNYVVSNVTTNTTLTVNDAGELITFTGSSPISITLPDAATLPLGWIVKIYNRGNAAITVNRAGTDTIDGATASRDVYRFAEIVKIAANDFAFLG